VQQPDTATIDPAVFRRAVGRFPTGITVVTTREGTHDHAMTVSAFTSVSLEPLLVLICVEIEARFHEAVMATGVWGVSILDGEGRAAAAWLATRGRPLHGQLDRTSHHYGPATAVHPGGDHSIVLGEVVAVGIDEEETSALVYHRGTYRHLD
jgi:flavin reductase (DIM6/NTAB) family NADH-FMN oxidoreductase RutF